MSRRRRKGTTRIGKIARLPYGVRVGVNRRLLNGYTGREIVVWLNSLPAVKRRMKQCYNGASVNNQNVSRWRWSGYRDWLRERAQRKEEEGVA